MKARIIALLVAAAVPGFVLARHPGILSAQAAQTQPPGGAVGDSKPGEPSKARMHQAEKRITDSFKGQDNFQVNGTLLGADAEHGGLVLQRGDLPLAFLIVPETAHISLNGESCTLGALPPGSDVRATFNLVQQYPVALEIKATQQAHGSP